MADIRRLGLEKKIADCFGHFDCISVRDENSLSILRELGFNNVSSHLDPALVSGLETAGWKNVEVPYEYALVYGYNNRFTEEEGESVCRVAESRGLKLLSVYGYQSFCDVNVSCRPDEILGYFAKAAFVVTDTFHGSIFSTIMRRPFVTISRGQNSNKLTDLLGKLGLTERLVSDDRGISDILACKCSFEIADVVRSRESARSLAYLKENIFLDDDWVGSSGSHNE